MKQKTNGGFPLVKQPETSVSHMRTGDDRFPSGDQEPATLVLSATDRILQRGLAHHRAGRLAEAEIFYRQVPHTSPGHPDALRLLGLISLQAGQPAMALPLFDQAIQGRPGFAEAYAARGNALYHLQQYQAAVESYDEAIRLQPRFAEAYSDRGVALLALGHYQADLQSCDGAIRLKPDFSAGGDVLGRGGAWKAAVESFDNAIRLDPYCADAYNNLGIALVEVGRDMDAIAAYAKAIEVKPDHANAYFNLGHLSARFDELPTAIGLFAKAIAIQPLHAYAHHELGSAQEKSGLLEAAAASYARSVELDPTRAVRENLANVLTLIGDSRGIEQLERLVREPPVSAESHWNLGMGLLLHRRYAPGWKEYEWRTEIPLLYKHHHRFSQPKWRGEPLEGKTILLYGEMGYGDTLQFLRYVPQVVERGGRVVLEVRPLLRSLLHTFPGVAECISTDEAKPAFSTHAPLMSLPYLLRAEKIPAPVSPVVQESSHAISLPCKQPNQLNVGLAWAGDSSQKRDRLRSIPLAQWKALAHIKGAAFTSLQMGPATPDPEESKACFHFVADCCDLADFAALAAVLSKLDLVITVDTAVAHLAGSMGKPVWILLPNAVDWRWGLDREATDWYSSARLFRQTAPGDWSGVMARVHQELQRLMDEPRRD